MIWSDGSEDKTDPNEERSPAMTAINAEGIPKGRLGVKSNWPVRFKDFCPI